jgi:myo-inositol 2-dehydrogenase/D-chiro-inositol 1-dehydrogenase
LNTTPLRFAIIGSGRMGRVHLAAFSRAQSGVPVAIVDPEVEPRRTAEAGGLRAYASAEELLEDNAVDGVVIAAPTRFHAGLVTTFANAKVPMLCEKPCGLSSSETAAAAQVAADNGVPLQVGFWMRFVPELKELRARIESGALGDILSISCWMWDAAPPSRDYLAASGGIALDMGVHEIDRARWLLGQEFESVQAVAAMARKPREFEDEPLAAQVLGALSGGATAAISLGRKFPHGDCAWSEIMGTKGHVRSTFLWGKDGDRVFEDAVLAQAEAFAEAVRLGDVTEGAATGADAVKTVRTAEQIREELRVSANAAGPT